MKKIVLIISYIFISLMAFSEVLLIEETGFVLEPPIGWEVIEITDSRWTFQDFTGNAFMQIKIFSGDTYVSASELCKSMMNKIAAKGNADSFNYYGRDALFAAIDFDKNDLSFSGYGFFVDGEDFDLAIISFADKSSITTLNDYVLSSLDSFALSSIMINNPGPVSTYFKQSYGNKKTEQKELTIRNQKINFLLDLYAIETSQLVIEREAAILADYKPDTAEGKEAWQRYYRMIYRDNYSRLDYLSNLIKQKVGLKNIHKTLLSWVQSFEYLRVGGKSDLSSPLTALANKQGDCDSNALLYIILLNHYGIDSALMVSLEYSHAMVAVDVGGSGARINYANREFLVGETTEKVEMGMIASDMADPAKWIVIPLYKEEPWK